MEEMIEFPMQCSKCECLIDDGMVYYKTNENRVCCEECSSGFKNRDLAVPREFDDDRWYEDW